VDRIVTFSACNSLGEFGAGDAGRDWPRPIELPTTQRDYRKDKERPSHGETSVDHHLVRIAFKAGGAVNEMPAALRLGSRPPVKLLKAVIRMCLLFESTLAAYPNMRKLTVAQFTAAS
jgi:hypothetical protein